MNRRLARSIIGCLPVSGRPKSAVQELARFDRRDWVQILNWLDMSGLSLYLFDTIEKSDGWTNLTPLVKDRLTKNHTDNRQRVAELTREFLGLNRLFRNHGIKHVVLKGLSKVPDFCYDATLRTQFDHDFLIEPESLALADRALRTTGYIPKSSHESHPREYILSGTPTWPRVGCTNFYSSHLARSVEIHTQLWDSESEGIRFELPEDFMQRSGNLSWGGQTYAALCDVDALLFEVIHAFRHLLRSWCRLSVLFEMAYFMERRHADSDFWQRFQERMKVVPRLSQAAGVVFALAERVFHCDIPTLARASTINALAPPQRLWVERYGANLAIDNFCRTKFGHFLHREFADGFSSPEAPSRRRLLPTWKRAWGGSVSAFRALLNSPNGLQQALYTMGRVYYHIIASLGYALEHSRWRRLRAKSLIGKEENA